MKRAMSFPFPFEFFGGTARFCSTAGLVVAGIGSFFMQMRSFFFVRNTRPTAHGWAIKESLCRWDRRRHKTERKRTRTRRIRDENMTTVARFHDASAAAAVACHIRRRRRRRRGRTPARTSRFHRISSTDGQSARRSQMRQSRATLCVCENRKKTPGERRDVRECIIDSAAITTRKKHQRGTLYVDEDSLSFLLLLLLLLQRRRRRRRRRWKSDRRVEIVGRNSHFRFVFFLFRCITSAPR